MSVETDEMRYYAQLDRDKARESYIEREAESEAKEFDAESYDWLKERFGENTAIALIDSDGYTDAEILQSVREARERYVKWRDTSSERVAASRWED